MNLREQTTHYISYIHAHPVSSLTAEEFSHIYTDLIDLIGQHNKLYYIDSMPIISDSQYDEFFNYLKSAEQAFPELIRHDSPTQRLTYQLQENFAQAEHPIPLLSLENSYNAEDLKDWDKGLQTLIDKYRKTTSEHTKYFIEDGSLLSCANAFIQTTEGTYLFQKRIFDKGKHPGCIGLFGGGIDDNEGPDKCLSREMKEELELQYTKKNVELYGDFPHPSHDGKYTRIYIIKNVDKNSLVLHEGEEIVETTLEDAMSLELTPLTQQVTSSLLQSQKNDSLVLSYTCEPKYDGISIELVYEHGQFVQAITRGDGYIGEDITGNVKTVLSVPYFLKEKNIAKLRVRGEIVMTKKGFERVNKERQEAGEALFANPRNATSGSLRQLDTSVTAKRGLICYVYEILELESNPQTILSTHEQSLTFLKEQGFLVFPWLKHGSSIDTVVTLCLDPHTKQTFDKQEIDFDGIVVKVNTLKVREVLGETNHHPKRAIAYKFPTQQIVTKLVSIDWQVGRTGILTPTANLDPVMLGGVTISRASLHNADFIRDKEILLGDHVWIQRSGEVIPYVIGPVTQSRSGEETEIEIPTHCPVCNTEVVRSKTDIHIYCPNALCPAQIKGKIAYWVSRDAMNIDGVGESIIESLVDQGVIHNVADLYTIDESQQRLQIVAMPLIGQKKYQNIVEELKKSKNNPLWRVINGLGIQHIGKKTAQIIVEAITARGYQEKKDFSLTDLEQLLSDREFLLSIKGIGEETITALSIWFANENNRLLLEKLVKQGINFAIFDLRKKVIEGKLSGMSFCITGTFEIPRKVLGDILAKHGGVVVDNVTQATHFLIVGNDPSSKVEKAGEYNIPLIEGLEKLEHRFPFLADDIEPMKLFAAKKVEKKKDAPKQQGLF